MSVISSEQAASNGRQQQRHSVMSEIASQLQFKTSASKPREPADLIRPDAGVATMIPQAVPIAEDDSDAGSCTSAATMQYHTAETACGRDCELACECNIPVTIQPNMRKSCETNHVIERQFDSMRKKEREKLAITIRARDHTVLETPPCINIDCPFCRTCLSYQRFKCLQYLQYLNINMWGGRSEIDKMGSAPAGILTGAPLGSCEFHKCPYCTGSLMRRRFRCMQRVHALNCVLWGEELAQDMHIDPSAGDDIVSLLLH